jgi:hypothetical protein
MKATLGCAAHIPLLHSHIMTVVDGSKLSQRHNLWKGLPLLSPGDRRFQAVTPACLETNPGGPATTSQVQCDTERTFARSKHATSAKLQALEAIAPAPAPAQLQSKQEILWSLTETNVTISVQFWVQTSDRYESGIMYFATESIP